jgi:O-methyltransferase
MDRAARIKDYEIRLRASFASGARAMTARVFRKYVAELSEPDQAFDELYLEGCFTTGTDVCPLRRRDRFRILVAQLERVLALEGRVAECGCFRGLSSYLLCSLLRRQAPAYSGAGYEIYDSFEGLSEPAEQDKGATDAQVVAANRLGQFAYPLTAVRQSLAAFPDITYRPGWIPDGFPHDDARYRFVHVDVDLYQPTRASFEYFWPRLVPGGVMVCDDYNWPGAKLAAEEFAKRAGAKFSVTASNQAIFDKS